MKHNQTILVVEDDRDFAQSLKLVFSLREIVIDVVYSGEEALTRFDPSRHRIVLTDIRLPGINGIELLNKIRAIQPGIPVLIMTGCDQNSAEVERAKTAGATNILFKPFNINQMLDRIELVWQQRKQVNR